MSGLWVIVLVFAAIAAFPQLLGRAANADEASVRKLRIGFAAVTLAFALFTITESK